jgi:predicted metalloprotease with PDZ domain
MRIPLLGAALACLALPLASLAAQNDGAAGRARLGIFLEERDGRSDSAGARVRGVVPEGPADKAGLERGDLLLRFNGTALGGTQKLLELARRLEPGDTVKLEYRRGSETRTATVVADRMRPRFAMMFNRMGGNGLADGPHMMFMRSHSRAGLALVQMSRDLGEYFGTSEGLLVVKPPIDSASPLKAGDVILAIDGRKPQSVEHAVKILGSYAPGEKAKLDVMRKRQRTSLSWTAPERRHQHGEHFGPGRRYGMEPGDRLESWGALDLQGPVPTPEAAPEFELPLPSPDTDFMIQVPSPLETEET